MHHGDSVVDGVTIRRCAYNGNLEETTRALTKEYVVEGLKVGDIVIINAYNSPTYYELTADGELTDDMSKTINLY